MTNFMIETGKGMKEREIFSYGLYSNLEKGLTEKQHYGDTKKNSDILAKFVAFFYNPQDTFVPRLLALSILQLCCREV